MSSNNKYKSLTLTEKIKILREVDNGRKTKTEIAKQYGIPLSTLSTFIKNRETIESQAESGETDGSKKRNRGAKHERLERELLDWFFQCRSNNIPLSGPLVKEKADMIALKSGIEFKCSNGWLQRFQKRNNIVSLRVTGEGSSVDKGAADTWRENVKHILQDYAAKDIFNMDESGIFFNILPDRTLAVKGERCHGGKRSKERLTVALCCNSDGTEKHPPWIIGKYANPRCFKGVKTLPCNYRSNKNAWMTASLFREWLLSFERRMAGQNRKILLIMDQCTAHNIEGLPLRNIKVLYLPANTTSYLQPLDQGIIYCLKGGYRKKLVRYFIRETARNVRVQEIRKWNVLDAMRNVCVSWEEISSSVIANCFRKAGFGEAMASDEGDAEEDFDWPELTGEVECPTNFRDYIVCDDNVIATSDESRAHESGGNLCDFEGEGCGVEASESDEEEQLVETAPVTRKEAFSAVSTVEMVLRERLKVNEELSKAFSVVSKHVHELYEKKCTQTTLDAFFCKK